LLRSSVNVARRWLQSQPAAFPRLSIRMPPPLDEKEPRIAIAAELKPGEGGKERRAGRWD
jgi:hypothetical protein